MALKFTNNASSLLAASIIDTDTTIQVEGGYGALFPSPTGSDAFYVTLQDASGNIEICRCTSRSTDLLTVVRGQDGTTAQSWTNGITRVELRTTAAVLESFIQRTGDTMAGTLDMNTNDLSNARLTGTTVVTGGQTVGTKIRGDEDTASNEIDVPSGGGQPTAAGSPIITDATLSIMTRFPTGTLILWYGTLGNIPSGWQLCDGTNGTPDLRDKFVIGAGNTYAKADTGGSTTISGTTGAAGSHDHGAATGSHTLTVAELPAHTHRLHAISGSGSFGEVQGFGTAGQNIGIAGDGSSASYRTDNAYGTQLVEDTGAQCNCFW